MVEMELHRLRPAQYGESCHDSKSDATSSERKLYYTLVDVAAGEVECPFHDNYAVAELRSKGTLVTESHETFTNVEIGAGVNRTNFNFYSHSADGKDTTGTCKNRLFFQNSRAIYN